MNRAIVGVCGLLMISACSDAKKGGKCDTARDCDEGQVCVTYADGSWACKTICWTTCDCDAAIPEVCDDGVCRTYAKSPCASGADCEDAYYCDHTSGFCAPLPQCVSLCDDMV